MSQERAAKWLRTLITANRIGKFKRKLHAEAPHNRICPHRFDGVRYFAVESRSMFVNSWQVILNISSWNLSELTRIRCEMRNIMHKEI